MNTIIAKLNLLRSFRRRSRKIHIVLSSHASFLFVSISSRDLTREIQKEGAFCAFSASSDDEQKNIVLLSEIVSKAIAEDTNRSELVGRAIAQLFFYSMFDFSREAF